MNVCLPTFMITYFWLNRLVSNLADLPNATLAQLPARIQCLFDEEGKGWTLLFDDSGSAVIKQQIISPMFKYFKFKQVLAYSQASEFN
jgi:hypothetical protein